MLAQKKFHQHLEKALDNTKDVEQALKDAYDSFEKEWFGIA